MGSRLLKLLAVLAVSLVTFLPLSVCQKTTGDIDERSLTRAVLWLPGCALTLTDQATGAVRKTTSNAQAISPFSTCLRNYTITRQRKVQGAVQKDVECTCHGDDAHPGVGDRRRHGNGAVEAKAVL